MNFQSFEIRDLVKANLSVLSQQIVLQKGTNLVFLEKRTYHRMSRQLNHRYSTYCSLSRLEDTVIVAEKINVSKRYLIQLANEWRGGHRSMVLPAVTWTNAWIAKKQSNVKFVYGEYRISELTNSLKWNLCKSTAFKIQMSRATSFVTSVKVYCYDVVSTVQSSPQAKRLLLWNSSIVRRIAQIRIDWFYQTFKNEDF